MVPLPETNGGMGTEAGSRPVHLERRAVCDLLSISFLCQGWAKLDCHLPKTWNGSIGGLCWTQCRALCSNRALCGNWLPAGRRWSWGAAGSNSATRDVIVMILGKDVHHTLPSRQSILPSPGGLISTWPPLGVNVSDPLKNSMQKAFHSCARSL